jgi:hypothetical protein
VAHRKNLDEVFLHRTKREVRKDATVRWEGGYLEVRPELMGEKVEIRWNPRDASVRPRVFVTAGRRGRSVPRGDEFNGGLTHEIAIVLESPDTHSPRVRREKPWVRLPWNAGIIAHLTRRRVCTGLGIVASA